MLKVKCDFCKEELKEFGGLVFSPPSIPIANMLGVEVNITGKRHMCVHCYERIIVKELKKD